MIYQVHSCVVLLSSFVLFWCCTQAAEEIIAVPTTSATLSIDLLRDEFDFGPLDSLVPEFFDVSSIEYSSDVYIEQQEFFYLSGLREHTTITRVDVKRACQMLAKKNKFSSITISVMNESDTKKKLFFELTGMWTFKAVKFQGLLRGAERYRQYYSLEPGELFDYQKHRHSLLKLKEALHAEGFLEGIINDYFEYDSVTKTVTAIVVFDKGKRFSIDAVTFSWLQEEMNVTYDYHALCKKITTRFYPLLHKADYAQSILNKQTSYLHHYLKKKGFLNARIQLKQVVHHQQGTVDLHFFITVHTKKSFIFFGNHFFSNQELSDTILDFGRSAELLPESLIAEEILHNYHKKGFKAVEINVKQDNQKKFFLVKEGSRSKLSNVVIEGATYDVKKIYSFFKPCLQEKYVDEDVIKQAMHNLMVWYRHEGFWDAEIIKQEYNSIQDSDSVTLSVTVKEGIRRYVRSVDGTLLTNFIDTNKITFLEEQIIKKPLAMSTLQEQRQLLSKELQKKGYLYTQVKPVFTPIGDNQIDVSWTLTGNTTHVSFGKVVIVGSSTFPYQNIMRELTFKEGDSWSKEKLEESLLNLRRLGIFETIQLHPYSQVDQDAEQMIIIKLVEDDPFEIRVRAGFQQVSKNLIFRRGSTYKVGGSLVYKNPCNQGDCIKVDTDFTRFYRNISAVYQRPWLFSEPILTVVKGYSNKYIQPLFIGSDKPLYQAIEQGFLVGFSRSWLHCDLGLQGGIELMETNHLSVLYAQAINFEPALIDKKVPYVYTEPSVVIDYLDNQVNPTRGSLTALSCKAMMSWKTKKVNFVKMLCEQSFFVPVMSLVWAFRLRFGHVFNQDFSAIMPPERFYLGGQNSIRSYNANQGPPLGVIINDHGDPEFVPQGGKSMVTANIECRFPLFWNIGGVVFQDLGMLAEKSMTEFCKARLLTAVGFGLRYYSPVGPLRFDIGWEWLKKDVCNSSFAWFLTFGHAF